MTTTRHVLAAAGLLVCGLSVAAPAVACPGEKASQAAQAAQAAKAADAHTECAYMNSRRAGGCCGSSFGSKLLAASVPAGLIAFGLGWLSGGRRRRGSDDKQA